MTVRTMPTAAAVLALIACLSGCGTGNGAAPSLNASGNHPLGWVTSNGGAHTAAFRATPTQCQTCHGSDLLVPNGSGGIVKVNCSSTTALGFTCHQGGHLPRVAPHAVPFTDPALHGPAAKANLIFCQGCHSTNPNGGAGSNPRFDAKIGSLVKGCEDCHNPQTAHPSTPAPNNSPWRGPFSHKNAAKLSQACALCHGATLNGAAEGGVGPACTSCHRTSPLVNQNCASCHGSLLASATAGLPASTPPGAQYPDIQGAHDTHDALPKVTGVCATCHTGGGIGNLNHFSGVSNGKVTTGIAASYQAKTGAFAHYSAAAGSLTDPNNTGGRCLNVSCHGGQTTPAWRIGSINPDTDCTSCHRSRAISDQYNSYFSGQHVFHLGSGVGLTCTDCHDTVKLATQHFTGLDTQQFEGIPSATIRDAVHYVGGSCTPDNTGGNFTITVCHGTRAWQ